MSTKTRFIISSFARMLAPDSPNDAGRVIRQQSFITRDSGLRCLGNYTSRMQSYNMNMRKFSVYSSNPSGASLPSQPPSSSPFRNWVLGIVLTIIFPIAGNQWGPFFQFKKEVDTAVEMIEEVAEVAEKVAEVVDKVAEGISGELPAGGLKKVVEAVEGVAEELARDAHAVGDAIDKFQEVEGKMENILGALTDQDNKNHKSNG